MEWQLHDTNEWMFGEKIRGIVRKRIAEVYHDPDQKHPWVWIVRVDTGVGIIRGLANSLTLAIEAAQ